MSVKINLNQEAINEIFLRTLFGTVIDTHAAAVENAPSGATNELKQKIDFFPKQYGFTEYKIVSQAGHSAATEYGTKPHPVSPKHLKDWARIVLGDENAAYAVAQKIKEVGTDAHPYMYPAFLEARKIFIQKNLKRQLSKKGINI